MPICNMTRNSKSVEISPFTKKRIVKVAFSVDFPHCGSLVLTFACKIYKWAYLGICPFTIFPFFGNFQKYAHLQYAHFFENS